MRGTRLRGARIAALALAATACAAAPGLAQTPAQPPATAGSGPSVSTDVGCYLAARTVKISGSGLTPGAPYAVFLDGHALGPGTTASDGSFAGTLSSGRLHRGASHAIHTVTVDQGSARATAQFQTTDFNAYFSPTTGNPRTLRVRFSVFGFAPGATDPVPLYLHYSSPTGRTTTIRIGRTHGPCGTLSRTREHHLFPFSPSAGSWRLQFDASERYSAASRPRVVRTVSVGR